MENLINMAKVSIITISYNNSKTIAETIESVIKQTYKNIEYIIVDGKSVDNTVGIIKSYGASITKFISEKDSGIYDAMNKGIMLARGDIIGFINADDKLNSDNCISEIVNVFQADDLDIVYGDKIYTKNNNTDKIVRYWKAGEYNRKNFKRGWMPPHLSTYIKASFYQKHGKFRTDFRIAADYELMFRFMYKYKAKSKYLPMVIARMRIGGISNKSIKNILVSNYEVYKSWKINGFHISPFIIARKPISKVTQLLGSNK
jgi:glycosyltransferase involved in cell wall biosynthesis